MAHLEKFAKNNLGVLLRHYDRSVGLSNGNENIDHSKSKLNYNLAAADQPLKQLDFIHKRLSQVKVQNRKDVNVMCSWVVTIPKPFYKNMYDENTQTFFKETYNFLSDRYGKNNVISAYVHLDEITPHMHFAFIPITEDKRKGGYKVSAKEVITRMDLRSFHKDLSNRMIDVFGYDIGIINKATEIGNKKVVELKRETLKELNNSIQEKQSEFDYKIQNSQRQLDLIDVEYQSKKAFIDQYDRFSDVSVAIPNYAKVKKNLLGKETVTVPLEQWKAKHISANEKSYLDRATQTFEKKINELKSSDEYLKQQDKIIELQNKVDKLERYNYGLTDYIKSLLNELNTANAKVRMYEKIVPQEMERLKPVDPQAMAKLENNIAVNVNKYLRSNNIDIDDIPFKSFLEKFEEKQIKEIQKNRNKGFDLEL